MVLIASSMVLVERIGFHLGGGARTILRLRAGDAVFEDKLQPAPDAVTQSS